MIDDDPVETRPTSQTSDNEDDEKAKNCHSKADLVDDELEKEESTQSSQRGGSRESSPGASSPYMNRGADFNSLFGEGKPPVPFPQLELVEHRSEGKKVDSNFEFPDGGWECSACSNYNFKGRKQCHRCKKDKDTADQSGLP